MTLHDPGHPANRLLHEASPYLLQHAYNPVDWYPWGAEAFARARQEEKPILLSVGYSACHWCHVMERESFEDAETAAIMNRFFVSIKVDREERPDVDTLYMQAVQAIAGQGGWPMTVFLTPDGAPFWGGTYFPPMDRPGLPSFKRVLVSLAHAWTDEREELLTSASRVREHIVQSMASQRAGAALEPAILEAAERGMLAQVDTQHGGLGQAPKFPQAMALEVLLRRWRATGSQPALAAVEGTLDAMARGGIYDHLGGGFHRYSTDARWLVPHFEKMLYDNALLTRAYLQGYQATHNPLYRSVAEETLGYLLRDMADPTGVFYSTEDADSEGEEGKYYVWTPQEIEAVVGPDDGPLVCAVFGVSERGSFEHGRSILHLSAPLQESAEALGIPAVRLQQILASSRRRLFQARQARVRPSRDDKVLTSWNGLALRALADAAVVLREPWCLDAALRCASALLATVQPATGRLLHMWKPGHAASGEGYLEDYANLADGLVALYEATFDPHWLQTAADLAETIKDRFLDPASAGFFDTSADHEHLLARPRDLFDSATPSGSAVAADVLLRLARHLDRPEYTQIAEGALSQVVDLAVQYPVGFGRALSALDFALSAAGEVVVVGVPGSETMEALLAAVSADFLPNKIVEGTPPEGATTQLALPLLRERPPVDGQATAYVCQGYVCQAPTTSLADLRVQLLELARVK